MPAGKPYVYKPPMKGALKGNPLGKGQLAGQRANLATWKASQATDPAKKTMFLNRAQKFSTRSNAFTRRATK